MLIPYNTDAPIYYFPFATIGLIALNTLVFVATAASPMQVDDKLIQPWLLQFGHGLHPLQWISSNFLHADIAHLAGNMIFLWAFGLVVEGKLGWWRFSALYLSIGVVFGAIIQVLMLGSDRTGALGASGVIFGLIAIALIWATRNDVSCVLLWGIRTRMVDVPITLFAAIYLVWQFVAAGLTGFAISTPVLHLVGGVVGAAFGVTLLKMDWVDCENWDVFALWQDRLGKPPVEKVDEPHKSVPTEIAMHEQNAALTTALKQAIHVGDAAGAARFYRKQREAHSDWKLDDADLMMLVKFLHQQKLMTESVFPMVDYLRQFPDRAVRMRLKLADILTTVDPRPARALQVLAKISTASLPAELQAAHAKLVKRAEKMQQEGELELVDDEEW